MHKTSPFPPRVRQIWERQRGTPVLPQPPFPHAGGPARQTQPCRHPVSRWRESVGSPRTLSLGVNRPISADGRVRMASCWYWRCRLSRCVFSATRSDELRFVLAVSQPSVCSLLIFMRCGCIPGGRRSTRLTRMLRRGHALLFCHPPLSLSSKVHPRLSPCARRS